MKQYTSEQAICKIGRFVGGYDYKEQCEKFGGMMALVCVPIEVVVIFINK